jgi:hypothetical protein
LRNERKSRELDHTNGTTYTGRAIMALRFIGVDPDTPNTGSPTVWVDEEDDSIVIQGWRIQDDKTLTGILETGPIPDHRQSYGFRDGWRRT